MSEQIHRGRVVRGRVVGRGRVVRGRVVGDELSGDELSGDELTYLLSLSFVLINLLHSRAFKKVPKGLEGMFTTPNKKKGLAVEMT